MGLDEKSRPKFKRNPHKFKKAKRKEKASAEKKSAAAESEAVAEIGSKRKNGGKQEQDLKRVRGEIVSHWTVSLERGREGWCVSVVSEKERQPLTRKERRNLKRRKRKNYDLISRTLQLWEKLRRCGHTCVPPMCWHVISNCAGMTWQRLNALICWSK